MKQLLKSIYKRVFSLKFRNQIITALKKLQSLFLSGNSVTCNCCGHSYRHFLPKGSVSKRENAECPHCGSLERTRLLLFFLEKETAAFERGKTVLHFAPENGLKAIFKAKKETHEYVNGDIDTDLADEVIDITKIQYPENAFDYIICSHVLGHVPDEKKAITEMFRVLKNGGTAIVLTLLNAENVPTHENEALITEEERLETYGEKDLVRLHGNDFAERLRNPGFQVEAINYEQQLPEAIRKQFQLSNHNRGTIFKCVKP